MAAVRTWKPCTPHAPTPDQQTGSQAALLLTRLCPALYSNVGGITYLDSIMLDYPGPDAESIKGQWEALEDMQATKHNLTNLTRTRTLPLP